MLLLDYYSHYRDDYLPTSLIQCYFDLIRSSDLDPSILFSSSVLTLSTITQQQQQLLLILYRFIVAHLWPACFFSTLTVIDQAKLHPTAVASSESHNSTPTISLLTRPTHDPSRMLCRHRSRPVLFMRRDLPYPHAHPRSCRLSYVGVAKGDG